MTQSLKQQFEEKFEEYKSGKNSVSLQYYDLPLPAIVAWIESKLSESRSETIKECLEVVEKMKKPKRLLQGISVKSHTKETHYNQALSDLKAKLTELINR